MRAKRRVRAGAIGVATALVAAATASGAVPPDDTARGKTWIAVGSASGAAGAEQQGVTVVWAGRLLSVFAFSVDESGLAAGEWTMNGFGLQDVGIGNRTMSAELEYTGVGRVGGDENALVMTGDVTTTGFVQGVGQQIDVTAPIPTLGISIEVRCGELFGRWALTVEGAFDDAGFETPTGFDGIMIGLDTRVGFSDEAIESLVDAGFTPDMLAAFAGNYSIVDRVELELATLEAHLALLTSAVERLSDDYPNWSGPDAYAVVDQIRAFINALRNLSGCTSGALGRDDVERWIDMLHDSLRSLIARLVELELFPGRPPRGQGFAAPPDSLEPDPAGSTVAFAQLVDFATRSGVIGAGALDPDDAATAEAELIAAGSRLLAGLDDAGGSDDDRRRVLATGALMGWTFDVGGTSVDAAEALAAMGVGS